MSSPTWTPTAVASEARPRRLSSWRAVEAQHAVATRPLVDTLAEQALLEDLLEEAKPPLPPGLAGLHYLLFTPFRYPPPPHGSRFRAATDPGVFYGADTVRTACAELGYWRWRFLVDSPELPDIPAREQTLFRVAIATACVDLRGPPFARDRAAWEDPRDHAACQAFARAAREAGVGAIRYASVRDPERGGCVALLRADGFAAAKPSQSQGWLLAVTRERVTWRRTDPLAPEAWEFAASGFSR